MDGRIILIDGHSILHRAFYGVPDLTTGDGVHTNAVYGFLNIMLHIMDEEQAQYLAVAFDLPAPTFRHKMYEAYKGTRKPMPQELREQVPVIQEMLQAMGIPLMMLEGYEADDLIGTVSLQASEAGLQVTIVSGDRDLLQLADEQVLVRIPKTSRGTTVVENYHTAEVIEKMGVRPEEIIDLKALMGDSSDNIPGLPGVGEKTAVKIIAAYHTIENAYAHADEITPNRARLAMQEHYDLAQLSKELATINRHSPFELDLEAARIGNIYTKEAQQLCRRLELKSLLPRFEQDDADDTGAASGPVIARTQEEWETWMAQLPAEIPVCGFYAWATDAADESKAKDEPGSTGEATAQAEMNNRCWTLAVPGADRPLICLCPEAPEPEWAAAAVHEVLGKARQIATIGLKEQLYVMDASWEEEFQDVFFDAAIAAYLVNPLKGHYTYDDIARDHLGELTPSREERIGKASYEQILGDANASEEPILQIFADTARIAAAAAPVLGGELEKTGMNRLFREVEMPLVYTLYHMQREGIAVRADELHDYGVRLAARIATLEQSIYEQAGETFNIQSPKQLGMILFEKMGLPFSKKTKTGYSTAADVLEKLAEDHPFVRDILEYRQLTKLKSTYADGLSAYIAEDGRIHGTFHQTITATGRISSADPNLQNIPVRTELGRELRKVFVPKDGYVFIDADYSQIELRVLAAASGDEKLIEAYRQAQDIHAITASQVFHIPLDQVTSQERRNAKAVNFGIVYGISSFGLSQGLSITRKEAQEFIERYFETYPGIKAYLDGRVASAKEKGYAVTLFGRRRPMPELKSGNFMQRSFGERVAMNAPIQGTAADIIKIAMVRVERRLREEGLDSRLILQIHDELLIETKDGEQDKVKAILSEEMKGAASLSVPLEIDMHEGHSWYEAK